MRKGAERYAVPQLGRMWGVDSCKHAGTHWSDQMHPPPPGKNPETGYSVEVPVLPGLTHSAPCATGTHREETYGFTAWML
eukprot:42261-Eustigmatos_ZCMA.PRE.1